MQKVYQETDDADRDVPFTLEEQKANAALYYTGLIVKLTEGLHNKGIAHQCAIGIQYTDVVRAKKEGSDLLKRSCVKRNLARCGVIAKATRGQCGIPEATRIVLVSMVIVSCNPGRSLIIWESEMQRWCLHYSRDGALKGVCLMFAKCDHGGGGAAKNADTPGYTA
jgi:hypothetical protein